MPASSSTGCRISSISSSMLIPRDALEVWRAMFDLPSPYDDGSLKYNYPEGRIYLTDSVLRSRIFLQDARDAQYRARLDASSACSSASCSASSRRRNLVAQPLAALLRAPLHGSAARLPGGRDRRLLPGDPLARRRFRPSSPCRSTRSARSARCSSRSSRMPTCSRTRACGRPAPTGSSASGSASCRRSCRTSLSYFLLRLEINVRASTIIGAVGGGGIGEVAAAVDQPGP